MPSNPARGTHGTHGAHGPVKPFEFYLPPLQPPPIGPPPPFGWFQPFSKPVLAAQQPTAGAETWTPTALPFQNPPTGWNIAWLDPARNRVYNEGYVAWNAQSPPNLPITPSQLGFYVEGFNPTLPPGRAAEGWFAWNPQTIAAVTLSLPFGWYVEWLDPIRVRPPIPDQLSWNPTAKPIQNPPLGWYLAWRDPLASRPVIPGVFSWAPTNAPIQNPPIGWLLRWLEPPRLAPRPTEGSGTWSATALPFQNPPFGWFAKWLEPTISKKPTDGTAVWAPTALPFQSPPFGWLRAWLDPVRNRAYNGGYIAWAPQTPPLLPVTPTQLGFYVERFNPPLLPGRAAEGWFAWDPEERPTIPPPPPIGWYLKWLEPPLLAPRATLGAETWIATALPFQSPPIGWLLSWLDPTRRRIYNEGFLAWNGQIIVPPFVPAKPLAVFSPAGALILNLESSAQLVSALLAFGAQNRLLVEAFGSSIFESIVPLSGELVVNTEALTADSESQVFSLGGLTIAAVEERAATIIPKLIALSAGVIS